MRKIWWIPIESLEERYSKQWNIWFPEEFNKNGYEYETIYPDTLTDKITNGSFLDVCGTNYFKAKQLSIICEKLYSGQISDEDIILVADMWFPGLEMLQYIRQGMGLKFKIMGMLHAGTYDHFDFLSKRGMGKWGKDLENSWFSFIDKIFVATKFHKRLICEKRKADPKKVIVTGFPIYDLYFNKDIVKENLVVFPHRLDSEKNPKLFDKLAEDLKFTGWKFIKSKEVCKTKSEYYDLLNRSKIAVSFADQETWGIAMQEALFANCYPVVPDKLSYSEMYMNQFKFNNYMEAVDIVRSLISNANGDRSDFAFYRDLNKKLLVQQGHQAISNMIKEMTA